MDCSDGHSWSKGPQQGLECIHCVYSLLFSLRSVLMLGAWLCICELCSDSHGSKCNHALVVAYVGTFFKFECQGGVLARPSSSVNVAAIACTWAPICRSIRGVDLVACVDWRGPRQCEKGSLLVMPFGQIFELPCIANKSRSHASGFVFASF